MNRKIPYPKDLPILEARGQIIRAIREHQVVIVCGETGSGKSTQIPKICLEAGRGQKGRIGSTQPRRIAAVTIANRIAQELGGDFPGAVGYKIRFKHSVGRQTRIKVMTDGILLAEAQGDNLLSEYDTLIIDEAHERSLNIDFILGLLKRILPRRRDLKVIISSATLETEKFSSFFWRAPVIQVEGRLYPVEVEYLPGDSKLLASGELSYVDMALEAMDSLWMRGLDGDCLIFMPTEQDIFETCRRLRGRDYPGVSVLPLFARLSAREQQRIYRVRGRKIVVATNVAETSLTIPGIRYVIDTGLARIPRYVARTRVTSMPISPISRASADQRKGRCGRIADGLCIRLYSEEDYLSREEFTRPEMLRANLAEVILRMIYLGLGDISAFPFLDPPPPRAVKDGFSTLEELGAIERKGGEVRLTAAGRKMARIPLDPKLSRMLLEARKEKCVSEVCVIAAALSIQDPSERAPEGEKDLEDRIHQFRDERSDFITILNVWEAMNKASKACLPVRQGGQNHSSLKAFCKKHSFSYMRMREWINIKAQIQEIIKEHGMLSRAGAGERRRQKKQLPAKSLYERVHRALLSGLLSNIALKKEKNIYVGTKGKEVMIFPGSCLFDKGPQWIVAAEMVKTSRLFARTAAAIDPKWAQEVGERFCKKRYLQPRWDRKLGQVIATTEVTLFGLVLSTDGIAPYGAVNPKEAHEIFVLHALVRGEVDERFGFLEHNLSLMEEVRDMEQRLRRALMVDEHTMASFYSGRLPGVHDIRTLKHTIHKKGGDEFLKMSLEDLLVERPCQEELAQYPKEVCIDSFKLPVRYKFTPGREDDGATLVVPLSVGCRLPKEALECVLPGLTRRRVEAMIKGLPKRYRRLLFPLPEKLDAIVEAVGKESDLPIAVRLSQVISEKFGVQIPASVLASVELPEHLKPRISVVDHQGKEIRAGRSLSVLEEISEFSLEGPDHEEWKKVCERWERFDLSRWDFGDLPERIEVVEGIIAVPALEKDHQRVNLRLFLAPKKAAASHRGGVEALYRKLLSKELRFLKRTLKIGPELERLSGYLGGRGALVDLVVDAISARLFFKNIRREKEFYEWARECVKRLIPTATSLTVHAGAVLKAYHQVRAQLYKMETRGELEKGVSTFCSGLRKELEQLVPRDFLLVYTEERLNHIPRYLKALAIRAERASYDLEKDQRKAFQLKEFLDALEEMKKEISKCSEGKRQVIEAFGWAVEEFKVATFAPELKTLQKVSARILREKVKEIERMV